MATPKEITATEKLLDLIRTSSSVTETVSLQQTADDHHPQLTLEESDQEGEIAAGAEVPSSPVDAIPQPEPVDSPTVFHGAGGLDDVLLPPTTAEEPPSPPPAPVQVKRPSLLQTSAFAIHRTLRRLRPLTKTTIAIDIQPGRVHLVKTQSSKGVHQLLACQSIPYGFEQDSRPEHLFTDQGFMEVLFRSLSAFIPRHGHHELWCSYAFCKPVGLHNISIPKVADKDVPTAVFWSAKRELEFDEATTLFDYSVLQELLESNLPKIQTLVTLVPKEELDGVDAMFKNAGFPLTGLTFPAAAIQNFLNQDQSIPADNPVVYFTIRRSSSFIDIFHHGKMFFSREIKTGTDSFVESLMDLALSQSILIDEESAKDYLFRPMDDADTTADGFEQLSAQFNFDGLAVIERLVRQLVRTFEYCATTFKTPPVSRIFTSGEYTVNEAILRAIESRIGIKCSVIEPLSPAIFDREIETPDHNTSELLVAAGLSLSDKETTANFLFTYKERAQEAATNRINAVIAIFTICLTIGCGGFFAWQYQAELAKKVKINSIKADLDQKYRQEPRSRSDDYASQTIQKIGQFHRDNKEKVKRFKVLALINELSKKIGPEIKITDLTLDLEQKTAESRSKKNEPSKPSPGTIELSGYISAAPEVQEFMLMNFLKSLATLNLLGEPRLKANTRTTLQDRSIMQFKITLKTTFGFLEPPSS